VTSSLNNCNHEGPWMEGEYCDSCPYKVSMHKVYGTDWELIMCDMYDSTHYCHILESGHYPCKARVLELETAWNEAVEAGELTPQDKG